MINRIRHILLLYLRETSFVLLFWVLVLGVLFAHFLFTDLDFHQWLVRYITTTQYPVFSIWSSVMLGAGIWITCLLGWMFKVQYAHPRSSLLPHYRSSHLMVGWICYLLIVIGAIWVIHVGGSFYQDTSDKQFAFFVAAVFFSAFNLILGYISWPTFAVVLWGMLCLFSNYEYFILTQILGEFLTNVFVLILTSSALLLLTWRLFHLKEEHWEYPYLFSWTRTSQRQHDALLTTLLDMVEKRLPSHQKHKPLKILRWDVLRFSIYKTILFFSAIILPFYLLYIKALSEYFLSFYQSPFKYFLLCAYSVIVIFGFHLRSISLWGRELLFPMERKRFIKEKGMNLLIQIYLLWLFLFILIILLPYMLLMPEFLMTAKFWSEILLTACFPLAGFGALTSLRDLSPRQSAFAFLGIVTITIFQMMQIKNLDVPILLMESFAWLFIGVLLIKMSYHKWCQTEF
ncbi:MAG: hypothetical protein NUV91_07010 [Candidatus Omnitrophica bacterium]|nr:hypothetical protein [Candidatus Omnitrophota bacterium]